jgi:hypothetical protein
MAQIKDLRAKVVKIDLGGKERIIKFDLNAYAELENRFGSVEKAMNILQEGSLVGLRSILWAGLIHDEAVIDEKTGEPTSYNVTPFMVGSWIEPTEMQSVSIKLSEAILATLPAAQRADAEKELDKLTASLAQEPVSSTEEQAIADAVVETEKNV